MMMVDTINPNTDQPDDFLNTTQQPEQPLGPVTPVGPTQENSSEMPTEGTNDHFFGGFDRPDEMKINLAGVPGEGSESFSGQNTEPIVSSPVASETVPLNDLTPTEVEASPFESQVHSSYNKSQNPGSKIPLVIVAVGVAATLLVGGVTYFLVNNANNTKLKAQQDELDNLVASLKSLQETPESLQITTTEAPITSEEETTTTTTVPVVPDTTDIQTTDTNTPADTGNQTKDGSLG